MNNGEHKFGWVALMGPPNAGKSTLLNALMGQKVTIVTPKPQTTRNQIVGILTEPGMQAVFMDTPGLSQGRGSLSKSMMQAVYESLRQADVVKISDEEIRWLWGVSPEEGARKLIDEYGVSLVYATLGPKGCHAVTANCSVTLQSPSGIHVVDTTGAGDIFGGSAMSRFLKCGKAPAELTKEELAGIVRFACTAASLSTQKHGGIGSVPEFDEVSKYL